MLFRSTQRGGSGGGEVAPSQAPKSTVVPALQSSLGQPVTVAEGGIVSDAGVGYAGVEEALKQYDRNKAAKEAAAAPAENAPTE